MDNIENLKTVWGRQPEDCPHLRRVQTVGQSFCVLAGGDHVGPVSRKIFREVICRSKEHEGCRLFLDWRSRVARQRFAENLKGEQIRKEAERADNHPVTVLS